MSSSARDIRYYEIIINRTNTYFSNLHTEEPEHAVFKVIPKVSGMSTPNRPAHGI
jgi:hypothetical protein